MSIAKSQLLQSAKSRRGEMQSAFDREMKTVESLSKRLKDLDAVIAYLEAYPEVEPNE
jgi:dienelactone hydrolase